MSRSIAAITVVCLSFCISRPGLTEQSSNVDDGPPPAGERIWTWVAFGASGAAGVAGVVLGSMAFSREQHLNSVCEAKLCPPGEQREIDRIRTMTRTADVLYGAAALGVGAGIILYFLEPRLGGEVLTAMPTVNEDGAGVMVEGRF